MDFGYGSRLCILSVITHLSPDASSYKRSANFWGLSETDRSVTQKVKKYNTGRFVE